MTLLYLIRHGETLWNAERRMQGWTDSPLSERGIQQARALAERLRKVEFAAIYSSPTGRAFQTAEIVRDRRALDIVPRPELREINLGDWEGRKWEELAKEEPERAERFWQSPHLYEPRSGETYEQVRQRAVPAIHEIAAAHGAEEKVLVVTHTVVLKLIVAHFEGQPLAGIWETTYLKPTSLTLVRVENGEGTVEGVGDVSHLTSDLTTPPYGV